MNRASRMIWKCLGVFLSVVAFCTCLMSAGIIYFGVNEGFYIQPKQRILDETLDGHLEGMCEDLAYQLVCDSYESATEHFKYYNFMFDIFYQGELVYSTRNGRAYMLSRDVMPDIDIYYERYVNDIYQGPDIVQGYKEGLFEVVGYIPQVLDKADEVRFIYRLIDIGYDLKYFVIVIAVISFFVALAGFVYLMCVAGHRVNKEEIVLSAFDVIPFDLYCILYYMLFLVEFGAVRYYLPSDIGFILLLPLNYLWLIFFSMSFAARVKKGGLFRKTFVYMALKAIAAVTVKLFKAILSFVISLSLHWRCTLIFAGIFLAVFLCYGLFGFATALSVSIILFFLLFCLALKVLHDYTEIKRGVDRISSGELYHTIPTDRMLVSSKRIAERINGIQENLQAVVESGIKSERFKAELITNVSHDLKTPLTSIINYIDLIAKESFESETLNEYIDVLKRQAKRLKKLTEDLVEASKASTGNVDIEYTECDLGELLTQVFGEFTERLDAEGLTLCASLPEESVHILADGKHLWRILDNIMSNVVKYALPSTRVWATLTVNEGCASLVVKNISREIINLTGVELTERFVRADASRNSEGSGLGLSIAKSLTELQGGDFSVTVDGDLFKVEIVFPICDGEY